MFYLLTKRNKIYKVLVKKNKRKSYLRRIKILVTKKFEIFLPPVKSKNFAK